MVTQKEYFKNIKNIETLKKRYRTLAKQMHPDLHGNTDAANNAMAELNKQFEKATKRITMNTYKKQQQKDGFRQQQQKETMEDFTDIHQDIIDKREFFSEYRGKILGARCKGQGGYRQLLLSVEKQQKKDKNLDM
jgi:DnaJ-class molecular chaperone